MLLRLSRRPLQPGRSRRLVQAYEQLQLPWLCPAFQDTSSSRCTTSISIPRSNPAAPLLSGPSTRPRPAGATDLPGRGFASPATATAIEGHEEYVPFDNIRGGPWSPRRFTELPSWDVGSLVRSEADAALDPLAYRRERGHVAEGEEVHAVLVAYLQVGQFEAAAATLRRIHKTQGLGSPAVYNAYMAYLATLVSHIIVAGDEALLHSTTRWFNEEVRARGIKPNGTMIMLLVQASLRASKKQKVGRMIRHFMHLAEKDAVLDEAREEMEVCFSDDELRRVQECAPSYFDLPATAIDNAAADPASSLSRVEIKPHPQKGSGLLALQQALSSFTRDSLIEDVPKDWDDAAVRQYRIERDVGQAALERWQVDMANMRKCGGESTIASKALSSLLWKWQEALTPLIATELATMSAQAPRSGSGIHNDIFPLLPLLKRMKPAQLAAITITATTRNVAHSGQRQLTGILIDIGKAIEDETTIDVIKERNREYFRRKGAKERRKVVGRLLWQERTGAPAAERLQGIVPSGEKQWTVTTRIRVAVLFLSLLLKVATIEVGKTVPGKATTLDTVPALSLGSFVRHGYRTSTLQFHPEFSLKARRDPPAALIAKHLPMLTPPVPWTGFRRGGYISQPHSVVRTTTQHANTKEYVEMAAANGDMDQIFAGLDVLGRTAWKINTPVFEVMAQVWNSGEQFGKIPAMHPNLPYPPEPADPTDIRAQRTYALECRQVDDRRDGMHSNRCFMNLQLEVARAYRDETFYFPHNMDFRGRAYPIPPYLNHMGADHCRGLLRFAEGKPLGEQGLWWLRVHLANVYGYDKASLTERHDFAVNHMDDIRDSAMRPLEGNRWWTTAEDQWQCLAACIELTNALDSPDPTQFASNLPVHQDGTCNGLQHYAALGGDKLGAMQVNLEPGSRPADVYTTVANMVQESIAKDALAGDSLAKALEGKMKRKIVKQTVMTNVYGVTLAGAKAQIHRQLDDHYPDLLKGVMHGKYFAATYIAHKVFQALATMFTGAHHIQYWLAECASRISTSLTPQQVKYLEEKHLNPLPTSDGKVKKRGPRGTARFGNVEARPRSTVVWTTPLRMPVVQPYRKTVMRRVETNLRILAVTETSPSDPVAKRKQIQAFPPNFIHSLDASHMLLTALRCDELGLSFASVHDSFWTHAGDVDVMNGVIRDSFVRMHSEDIIGRLKAEFDARYNGCMYLMAVPRFSQLGKAIAERVPGLTSRLKTKGTTTQLVRDLLRERKRLRLLQSEDAADRAEGQAMVTPASIFEEMGAQNQSFIPKLDASLGDVPNPLTEERDAFLKEVLGEEYDKTPVAERAVTAANMESLDGDETPSAELKSSFLHIPELDGDLTDEQRQARDELRRKRKNASWRWHRKLYVWLPMTIPEVPQRGDFDVKRTESSQYFFS